ncbi:MAG: hypothetical protein AABW59_00225 [archaeon]
MLPSRKRVTRRIIPKQRLILLSAAKPARRAYYTPRFGQYMEKNKGIAVKTYRFVTKNLERFKGKSLVDPRTGVRVEPTFTGSYTGEESITFKVTHGRRKFFLKLTPEHMEANEPQAYKAAENLFRMMDNKVGRYNVALIRPHLIYCPKSQDAYRVVVTDFFEKDEVVHLAQGGLNETAFSKMFEAEVNKLSKLGTQSGVNDLDRHNLFYHKKSRTLLFFDPL